MLVIYFISNICGFYVSYRFGHGLSVGSSAAIFGLIGCMIAFGVPERKRSSFVFSVAVTETWLMKTVTSIRALAAAVLVIPQIEHPAATSGNGAGHAHQE